MDICNRNRVVQNLLSNFFLYELQQIYVFLLYKIQQIYVIFDLN